MYDERYLDHMLPPSGGAPHPERPLRLQRIREMFVARGLDRELTPCTLADMDPSVHKLEDEQTGLGWRRINYHPQSGWFDEGPSKGPPPCGRGLKPPEVLLLLVFFLFLLVADVVPNNGLV